MIHGEALPSSLPGIYSLLPKLAYSEPSHCPLYSSPLRQHFGILFNVNMFSQTGALEIITSNIECALVQKISKGKQVRKMHICVSSSDSQTFSYFSFR